MSFNIVNGRQIEILDDYPGFFEPKPVSPKRKSTQPLFVDLSGNIHIQIHEHIRKPIIKRRFGYPLQNYKMQSILGKRKLEDAFGSGVNDSERYGQEISNDFFEKNVGHGVRPDFSVNQKPPFINVPINTATNTPVNSPANVPAYDEAEILEWCAKYLASKRL